MDNLVHFKCDQCGEQYHAGLEHKGKSIECSVCKKILIIITEDSNWQRIDRREILIKIEF